MGQYVEYETPTEVLQIPKTPVSANGILQHADSTVEWYTPPKYLDLVRRCFGGQIDLDPASCGIAQQWVQADTFYTAAQDGLSLPWFGNVFLNPPYGKIKNVSNQDTWSKHLIEAYLEGDIQSAILLVNSNTGTAWFQRILRMNVPVCFVGKRIRFIDANGIEQDRPRYDNAFVNCGVPPQVFGEVFSTIGTIR